MLVAVLPPLCSPGIVSGTLRPQILRSWNPPLFAASPTAPPFAVSVSRCASPPAASSSPSHLLRDPSRESVEEPVMFTNDQRQEERTGRSGTPRLQYLQDVVTQFQEATDEEFKERLVSHLTNFAYDPYNYGFLRQLNVVELFLDCITEPNEKLVEFGIGGICNCCVDPANASIIIQCGGLPSIIGCLSSPVKSTVNYAIASLYYLCNSSTEREILRPQVVEVLRKYAAAEGTSFCNLAHAFLKKHVR